MRAFGFALVVLAGSLSVSSDIHAQTNKVYAFSSGNWTGTAYYKAGRFSHCQMSAKYRNGSKLIFGLEPNKSMSVGILHPSWNLKKGNREQVRISIDNRTALWSTARVIRPQHIAAFFKANSRIYNMMRHGRRLAIEAGGTVLKYSLRGTSRALIRLLNCTINGIRYNNRRIAAPAPPAPPALQPQPGSSLFNSAGVAPRPAQPVRRPLPNPNRKTPFKSGNWRGAAYYKNGRFTHCAMSASYKSGSKLIIGLERTKAMSIGVTHPQWRMTKGQRMGVNFSVDGRPGLSAMAKVISPTHYAAFFKSNREFFGMIRTGKTLAISFGGAAQKFKLDGMYGASRELLKCAVSALEAEKALTRTPPPNPFTAPAAPAAPPNPFNKPAAPPAAPANPFSNQPLAPPPPPANPFGAPSSAPPPPVGALPLAPKANENAI